MTSKLQGTNPFHQCSSQLHHRLKRDKNQKGTYSDDTKDSSWIFGFKAMVSRMNHYIPECFSRAHSHSLALLVCCSSCQSQWNLQTLASTCAFSGMVQLGQLLDLHFCLVAPYILETSPESHQVVERDDH